MIATKINGRTTTIDGKEYVYFGGTSYLNLPYESTFHGFVTEGMALYGNSLGSSPITAPRLAIYEELEAFLAQYYGFEAALLFATGRAATQALVQLAAKRFHIIYGPFAHSTLQTRQTNSESAPTIWINDFIDPISLERVDEVDDIPEGPKIIDASHAFGVLDKDLGAFCQRQNAFACGSLNKGLGIHAGLVLCDSETKKALQQTLAYQSSSNASPALCYALLRAFEGGFIEEQQEKLQNFVNQLASIEKIEIKPPFPVGYFKSRAPLYDKLKDNSVLLWKGGYGAPLVKPNRFVVCAGHSKSDVLRLITLEP